jgi:hypothetical protein
MEVINTNTKNNLQEVLVSILKQYDVEDEVLWQLRYKYMLHIDLCKEMH